MAEGILGLGSEGSASLNQELIDQLKEKESESKVQPIETQLEDIQLEIEIVDEIEAKTLELLETIKPFDLYVSGTNNIFNEVSATTSGEAVNFDAVDTSGLTPGTTNVNVSQLATKDVYQSDKITAVSSDIMTSGQNEDDVLTIEVDGETFNFPTKDKTYEQLAQEISLQSNNKLVASVEYVSDDEFRIVIKSAQTGEANSLSISQSANLDLGFDKPENHTLSAENMIANIDGVDYNVSSNTITTQGGLTVTGISLGDSSITIKKDTQAIMDSTLLLAQQYNELVSMIEDATLDPESPVQDKSSLKTMMDSIKSILFSTYGLDDEESIFNYGISFDEYGYMNVDSQAFSEALNENVDDLEELFVGYAEKEGMGTQLKTYLDSLDSFDGLLTTYDENILGRQSKLEEEKTKAIESLDTKYSQMSQEFADATVLISQMEAEFASLKSIIAADS